MRIGTVNLLHGIDMRTGRVDLGAAAEAIAALDLDVACLQEVDRDLPRSGSHDQVAALAERLGLTGIFAPALLGDPDDRWRAIGEGDPGGPAYGVGILSRLPVVRTVRTVLPGGGDGRREPGGSLGNPGWDHEPRTALTAVLDAGGGVLRVTSTHLSYLPWRGAAQLRRAAAAAAGPDAEPAVLAGDLNLPVWPVRALLGRDWEHAGGSPTYPSWEPKIQVDQIAVTGGVEVTAITVAETGPSDHRAVVATLRVPEVGVRPLG